MRLIYLCATTAFLSITTSLARGDQPAVDDPLLANASQNVRPADLLTVDLNGELAVDEPLEPNASGNVRPADLLVVDRAFDLFARPTDAPRAVGSVGAPSNPKTRGLPFGRTLLYVPDGHDRARLAVDATTPISGEAALSFERSAESLDVLERGRAEARWYATVESSGGPARFGELVVTKDNGGTDEGGVDNRPPTVPVIGRVRGVADAALALPGRDGRSWGWVFVARGPGDGEAWGVLDAVTGEANPSLRIVHTIDGGATWADRPLAKPAPTAEFSSMAMAADGRGQIVLYLPAERGGLRPGFYPYTTTDRGRTWTAGRTAAADDGRDVMAFDGNALIDAVAPRRVASSWYGGSGHFYCHRPLRRPGGYEPAHPAWRDPIAPSVHDAGRLKALENPGFDDRMEKGKVPSRFDVTPKPEPAPTDDVNRITR